MDNSHTLLRCTLLKRIVDTLHQMDGTLGLIRHRGYGYIPSKIKGHHIPDEYELDQRRGIVQSLIKDLTLRTAIEHHCPPPLGRAVVYTTRLSAGQVRACPFCGSDDITGGMHVEGFRIYCFDCHATMYGSTFEETLTKWNRDYRMEYHLQQKNKP